MSLPFLTQLDTRAQVKGSRDPLGTQPLWSALGGEIVGNLTTVSNSVRDFTTLLLGYYFAEELPDHRPVDVFMRWEQWAAYARTELANDATFPVRGVERVKARLREEKPVVISAEQGHQILSQQQTYGLWGIYSSAARASGLLEARGEQRFLTEASRRFVETEYLPRLRKSGIDWQEMLGRPRLRCDWQGAHLKALKTVADVLSPTAKTLRPGETEFYREHLLHGGPLLEDGLRQVQQGAAARMPRRLLQGNRMSPAILREWKERAGKAGAVDLEARLDQIEVAESVLAPAAALFSFLIGQSRKEADVIHDIAKSWRNGFEDLRVEDFAARRPWFDAKTNRKDGGADWLCVAGSLREGDFRETVAALCRINAGVMQERGGAAWIHREGGRLEIRYGEGREGLPAPRDPLLRWQNSYFLDSLALVARQLEALA